MICNKCNRKNENTRKKCKHCGAKLNQVTLSNSAQANGAAKQSATSNSKVVLVCNIISLVLTCVSFFISLFAIISVAAFVLAVVASVFAIKNKQLLALSTTTLALASASLLLNLYVLVIAMLV